MLQWPRSKGGKAKRGSALLHEMRQPGDLVPSATSSPKKKGRSFGFFVSLSCLLPARRARREMPRVGGVAPFSVCVVASDGACSRNPADVSMPHAVLQHVPVWAIAVIMRNLSGDNTHEYCERYTFLVRVRTGHALRPNNVISQVTRSSFNWRPVTTPQWRRKLLIPKVRYVYRRTPRT